MNELLISEIVVGLVVQISLIIGVTFALDRWLLDPRANCRLWTTCLVAILFLVVVAFVFPHYRLFVTHTVAPGSAMAAVVLWQAWVVPICIGIWLLGFVVIVVRCIASYLVLTCFLRRQCRDLSEAELAALPFARDEFPARTRLLVTNATASPFCWQFHKPTIVVPESVLFDSETEIRHVLLHEIEHLRTNHPLQHFLQGVCVSVLWFHPVTWLAARRAALVREFLCDEYAALSDGNVTSYLRTLVKIAERGNGLPACALSFGRTKSAIVRRSNRLAKVFEQRTAGSLQRRFAVASLILLAVMASQLSLPVNALASTRTRWSPWPTWTASVLHDFDLNVRDYESFDDRHGFHDLVHAD